MKKILLMIQDIHSYDKKIINEIRKEGYEVECFDALKYKYKEARKIKNPLLRIYNDKYLKKYRGINLKDRREGEALLEDLKKLSYDFDIFLKIGCIYLPENVLQYLNSKISICISHHWDSSSRMEKCNFKLEKKYFNKIYSYDREDVEKFKLEYLPNFYYIDNDKNNKLEYDIYALVGKTEEKRETLLYKIAKNCLKNNIKINFTLYNPEILEEKKDIITITNKAISFTKMLEECKKSKAILELGHSLNKGFTFRTFDCVGMKKKLITTNREIVSEDFYNPNNILVIDENNIEVPKKFLDLPYEELPKEIYEKYSLENWIKQLLNIR